jgi:hypothetical protein
MLAKAMMDYKIDQLATGWLRLLKKAFSKAAGK